MADGGPGELEARVKFVATLDDKPTPVEVTGADGRYRLTIGGEVWDVDARLTPQGITSLLIDGVSYVADVIDREGACVVEVHGETYVIDVEQVPLSGFESLIDAGRLLDARVIAALYMARTFLAREHAAASPTAGESTG